MSAKKKNTFVETIRIQNGKIADWAKPLLKMKFDSLKDGKYKIKAEYESENYTPTRYKYLFDCVYRLALPYAQKRLKKKTIAGDIISIEDTEELHKVMLRKFNNIELIDETTGETSIVPDSSRNLKDNEFWFPFVEAIRLYFSESPYYLEIPDQDEWALVRKNGGRAAWESYESEWHDYMKQQTISNI